jgi:hypothetical protein
MPETKKTNKAALCLTGKAELLLADNVVGEEKKKRFRLTGNTGDLIKNHWYWGNFVVDLASMILGKDSYPVFKEHCTSCIVGRSETITINSKTGLVVDGIFSDVEETEGPFVHKTLAEGHPWEASIYGEPEFVEFVPEGASVEVNERTFEGPLNVWRNTLFREVSFAGLGWDHRTSAEMLGKQENELEIKIITKEKEIMADTVVTPTPPVPVPDDAAKLAAITEQAKLEERNRLSNLKLAFPNDQEFALSQYEAGSTVDQAKLAYVDVLTAKNKELAEKLAASDTTPPAPTPPAPAPNGVKPVGAPASDDANALAVPEGKGSAFERILKKNQRERKLSYKEALRQTKDEQPKEFQEYALSKQGPKVKPEHIEF